MVSTRPIGIGLPLVAGRAFAHCAIPHRWGRFRIAPCLSPSAIAGRLAQKQSPILTPAWGAPALRCGAPAYRKPTQPGRRGARAQAARLVDAPAEFGSSAQDAKEVQAASARSVIPGSSRLGWRPMNTVDSPTEHDQRGEHSPEALGLCVVQQEPEASACPKPNPSLGSSSKVRSRPLAGMDDHLMTHRKRSI